MSPLHKSAVACRLVPLVVALGLALPGCVDSSKPAPPTPPPPHSLSMDLLNEMGLGWNLGNTLDAVGGETAWGNPPTTQAMIQAVAAAGFKSMRIPITWRQHFGPAPTYTIDPLWMARVAEIVDWALGAGLYVIINLHHDGGDDVKQGAWIRQAATDYAGIIAEYSALWTQIAGRFQDYDGHLIFESMNEVGFDGIAPQTAFDLLNRINAQFVSLVRATGGNNGQRRLLIAGYYTDIDQSVRGVVMPPDPGCILSIHYYTPWEFCIKGDPPTWGTAGDVSMLKTQFAKLRPAFLDKDVPVIIGEYGVNTKADPASRLFWMEYATKTACDYGMPPFLWDNGEELDRSTLTWRTPGLIEALQRACSGQDYVPTKG